MNDTVVSCRELSKVYNDGQQVLRVLEAVDLSLGKGEQLAVVGSSGSGKSSLLNLLAGLDTPSGGTVEICGESFSALDEAGRSRLRNRHLGVVYQFHHLLPEFTALENTAMPLLLRRDFSLARARREARALLDEVGLSARRDHKPAALSGGERQRVAIARALVTRPALVLMDEPTGNLDSHTAATVQELMRQLGQQTGTAFIVVTHDSRLAASMDRVLELVNGELRPVDQAS
ncbi:MAG: ATP-binding cassette domain-containing protein [Kistimonas sp.]|nr:ATP-binding cassette domain-containing protein [Kistimonas sp.]